MDKNKIYYRAVDCDNYEMLGAMIKMTKPGILSVKLTDNVDDKNRCELFSPYHLPKVFIVPSKHDHFYYVDITCDHCKLKENEVDTYFSETDLVYICPYISPEYNRIPLRWRNFQTVNARMCSQCYDKAPKKKKIKIHHVFNMRLRKRKLPRTCKKEKIIVSDKKKLVYSIMF